jgi:hypothetical protein
MERVQGSWINLDKYISLDNFETSGPLLYPHSEADASRAYQKLKAADALFLVYRRAQVPAYLHYTTNPREGDPVVVPKGPYMIRGHAPPAGREDHPPPAGEHGYDPYEMHSMRAIFFADGPDIKPGVAVKPFENINVFPLVTKILGLENPPIDGSLNVLSGVLQDQGKQDEGKQ